MKVTTVGLDLAKNVIQVHGVDGRGWLVVTNVCASAFDKRGGTSKRPRLVSVHSLCLRIRSGTPRPSCGPAVRTTAESARVPGMRFAAVKAAAQQDLQTLVRLCEGAVSSHTAPVNQLRGLLGEYGIVVA